MSSTVRELYDYIDSLAPFATAESWDNVGLLVGDPDQLVTGILTALDVTSDVLTQAEALGSNLVISHHPIIFDQTKRFTAESRAYAAARRGISVICAHTNLDKAGWGVNQILAELLGLCNLRPLQPDGLGRVGELSTPMSPGAFAAQIKERLGLQPRYNPNGRQMIRRVGLCGGSGGELATIADLGIDAFVSGDVKQDEYLDAGAHGITLYDAGHYATEYPVIPVLTRRLTSRFPELRIAEATGYTGQIIG